MFPVFTRLRYHVSRWVSGSITGKFRWWFSARLCRQMRYLISSIRCLEQSPVWLCRKTLLKLQISAVSCGSAELVRSARLKSLQRNRSGRSELRNYCDSSTTNYSLPSSGYTRMGDSSSGVERGSHSRKLRELGRGKGVNRPRGRGKYARPVIKWTPSLGLQPAAVTTTTRKVDSVLLH